MTDELVVQQYGGNLPAPVVSIQQWATRRKEFNEWVNSQLIKGVDYGVIPGTDKRTLLKPGAEKILQFYGCALLIEKDTHEQDIASGYLSKEYILKAVNIATGIIVGIGVGMASSYESKHRWRWEYWKGKSAPPEAEGWESGRGKTGAYWRRRIENRDLIDIWNTVVKIAKKRAMVDLALTISGASEKFTQDVEDFIDVEFSRVQDETETEEQGKSGVKQEDKQQVKQQMSEAKPQRVEIKAQAKQQVKPREPLAPDKLRAVLIEKASKENETSQKAKPTDGHRGLVVGKLGGLITGDAEAKEQGRHMFLEYVFGTPTSKELTVAQVNAILAWIDKDAEIAKLELADVITTQLRAKGQLDMTT